MHLKRKKFLVMYTATWAMAVMNTYFNSWLCKDLASKLHLHKVCLHLLKCSNCNYFFLFQSRTVLLAFLADSFSLGGGRGCRAHLVNAKQWVSLKKQCVSSSLPVIVIYEGEILWFNNSNETSLPELSQCTIWFSEIYSMKFGMFPPNFDLCQLCKWTGLYWNSPVSGSLSKRRNLCWFCYCESLFQSGGKNWALHLNFHFNPLNVIKINNTNNKYCVLWLFARGSSE